MTVPNTPPDPVRAEPAAAAEPAPGAPNPAGSGAEPVGRKRPPLASLAPEAQLGASIVLVSLVLGLVLGALWAWLAPKVPLVVDGNRVLYGDPEGEQRAGADAVFALLGLGMGVLTALGAFLLTRRRGGGIAVAVGLAVGGLLGSLGAWKLGLWLGPDENLVAQAAQVGDGGHFSANLELGAQGALLVWPMTAMVVLLALSAAFGKREEDPPPYWAGPHPGPDPERQPQDRVVPPSLEKPQP